MFDIQFPQFSDPKESDELLMFAVPETDKVTQVKGWIGEGWRGDGAVWGTEIFWDELEYLRWVCWIFVS